VQAELVPAIREHRKGATQAALPGYAELMRASRFPADLRTAAFAGVITQALAARRGTLIRGMTERSFQALMRSCFPGYRLQNGWLPRPDGPAADEFDDLLDLLLDHRTHACEATTWLSCAIASAAMHDNHLWQDMGLPSRSLLSQLLRDNYPTLAARNTGDMKWKKFFYRQLCERAGVMICKSPNCAECCDYELCFSPESPATRRIDVRGS
jgi:nitrogen fixation protein NifQ